jgi:peptidyl-dipeptidase A
MRCFLLIAALLASCLPGNAETQTSQAAEAFVAKAESDLQAMQERFNRAYWIGLTYINTDSTWLKAKADAELTLLQLEQAKQAASFDGVDVGPITRRKLTVLKRNLVLAPPSSVEAAEELASITAQLGTIYSTGKVNYQGKQLTLDDIAEIMRSSRDPAELKALWEGWHAISPPMRSDYERLVSLANDGARALGYADTGMMWRSWYDMPPEDFRATVERLWTQLAPLYKELHCYVRGRLNDKYGSDIQARTGPIRADLLGNMWSQDWSNIYDVVAPADAKLGYDLTSALVKQNYDAVKLIHIAEDFYESIGFAALPQTFWERSMFIRPRDREVDCHAQAWNVDTRGDVRIAGCYRPNSDDFYTVHHELGHSYYDLTYSTQPYLFQNGANDGFHEAVGDFVGLNSISPTYLKAIGLLDEVPGPEADIPYLLLNALDKLAFLPFAYIVDNWRWQVFSGEITPDRYNEGWWELRTKYQGIMPPGPRPADAFDPGAKYHIPLSVPYMRYFLAMMYQYQFQRAACRQAGWTGPLARCSIYGDKDVGEHFRAMLRLGVSKPWPDALEAFAGEREIEASGIIDYFAPLNAWLREQNKGEACGW